VVLMFEFR